jgi:hypothetical protein
MAIVPVALGCLRVSSYYPMFLDTVLPNYAISVIPKVMERQNAGLLVLAVSAEAFDI